jgi:AraC-like DNA-binding protein
MMVGLLLYGGGVRHHFRPQPTRRTSHTGKSEGVRPSIGPVLAGSPVERLSLASRDIDEVRTFGGSHFYPRRFLHPLQRSGRLAARFNVLRLGAVTIGDVQYGADVTLGYEHPDAYQVGVPVAGRLIARQGGRTIIGAGDQAPVFRVGEEVILDHWSADCRQLGVKIDRSLLESQLGTLLDAPVRTPIELPAQLDIASGPGRSWATVIRLLAAEFDSDTGLFDHPLIIERLYEVLISGLLLATDHPYRGQLTGRDRAYRPTSVRRAIDMIHAHPEYPFTVVTLARAAGVSVRTLQAGFQRYLDTTPMGYLRHLRLTRVHDDLLAADPRDSTVTDIAHRWGFMHLGRFSGAYRQRYHTTPAQTLRRRSAEDILG